MSSVIFLLFLSADAVKPVFPSGVVTDFPHMELTKMGFIQHYNRTFSEYWIIDKIKPPKPTVQWAFMGCRNVKDENIKIGMFGNATFFFEQQHFAYNKTDSGIAHNGAFYYYSSNNGLPMGFSPTKEIFLYSVDIYDCAVLHHNDIYCPQNQMDPLRMSLHSSKSALENC